MRPGPEVLTALELRRAFAYATDWLGVYAGEINALNVYPVPDGDTGSNMHLTMQAATRQLAQDDPETMAQLARALAYGALLGARGNSGVILSQLLEGLGEAMKQREVLDAEACKRALESASRGAYAAVARPVEGTILTVVREAAEGARRVRSSLPLDILKGAHRAAAAALEQTPELLPMLKQAGVVDAGGLGLVRLLEGLSAFFEGRDLPSPPKVKTRAQTRFEKEEFGYCTEFLLSRATCSSQEMRALVEPFGDSLLVVGAEGYIKGHIHTHEPEKLLSLVATRGVMVRSKVEDMSEQHSEILAGSDMAGAAVAAPKSALVAVSPGYGPTKVFRSLGARVVGGGQSANPSVEEIAEAVRGVGAEQVIILPNNPNVVLAAERAGALLPEKEVTVLPTRTLGQGLAAAVLFTESSDAAELYEEMAAATEHSLTLEVAKAERKAEVNGVHIGEGDYIGLVDGKLRTAAPSATTCLLELFKFARRCDIATLFYSSHLSPDERDVLAEELAERLELEIEMRAGGPEAYAFVVALE
jgi:DAK2 domain fusion protein YloV